MQWRKNSLIGGFVLLLLAVHACTPGLQETEQSSSTKEVVPPEAVKPQPLPIQFVEAPKPKPKPKLKPQPVKPKKAKKEGSGKQGKGSLNVIGRFDCSVDFYLDVMMREGARLLLYEQNGPDYYDIHPDGGITPLSSLSGDFAPIARNLTLDHPQSSTFIQRAEQRFGPGVYEVVLLVPASVQKRIDRMVDQVVSATDDAVGTISVRYQRSGDRLLIEFEKVVLNGETVALNSRIAF